MEEQTREGLHFYSILWAGYRDSQKRLLEGVSRGQSRENIPFQVYKADNFAEYSTLVLKKPRVAVISHPLQWDIPALLVSKRKSEPQLAALVNVLSEAAPKTPVVVISSAGEARYDQVNSYFRENVRIEEILHEAQFSDPAGPKRFVSFVGQYTSQGVGVPRYIASTARQSKK